MIPLASGARVWLATGHTDMRKGFDSLAQLVRSHLAGDPLSGHLFVFRSKRGDRLKVLYWDSDGLCLWYKRLELGVFTLPAAGASVGEHGLEIRAGDFALLHHLMPHGASHNRRPTTRVAQFLRFVRDDQPHGYGSQPPRPYNAAQLGAITPLGRRLLGLDSW